MIKVVKKNKKTSRVKFFIDEIDVTIFLAYAKGALLNYDYKEKYDFITMSNANIEKWKNIDNQKLFDEIVPGVFHSKIAAEKAAELKEMIEKYSESSRFRNIVQFDDILKND